MAVSYNKLFKLLIALLNGITFDDLDEDLDFGDKCQSLTHGEKPIVKNFENANNEFEFLLHEVKRLKENGVSLTDICDIDYIALFTKAGIRSYAIKKNKVDDRSFDGLRVATMHRVKGLEFKYVFIAAVNNGIIPLPSAINKTDVVSEMESITSEKCLLYVDINAIIEKIQEVSELSYNYYKPLVDSIIVEKASENEVEHLLDYMLDVCHDDRMLKLFKKVCRRYYKFYPEMITSEILAYKEWYED